MAPRAGRADRGGRYQPVRPGLFRAQAALASVIAMGTPAIVLDEPTTGQDANGVERVKRIVEELASEGRTVVAISHDMTFVAEAFERVLVMRDGRLVLDAPVGEVFGEKNWRVLESTYLEPPLAAALGARLGSATPITAAFFRLGPRNAGYDWARSEPVMSSREARSDSAIARSGSWRASGVHLLMVEPLRRDGMGDSGDRGRDHVLLLADHRGLVSRSTRPEAPRRRGPVRGGTPDGSAEPSALAAPRHRSGRSTTRTKTSVVIALELPPSPAQLSIRTESR